MNANNPDTAVTGVPSLEELRSSADPVEVRANPETRRIRWTLNGPLETAITVARDYWFDADEAPEPYYLGPTSGNDDDDDDAASGKKPTWHPFAQSPLTEPKVSSLRLYVEPLNDWDYHWMETHEGHTEPDAKHTYNPASVLYGPLPPGRDGGAQLQGDDDGEHLLMCCGEKRPLRYLGEGTRDVVIRPTTSRGDFVTIHDFISSVHPYLMARRDEILQAIGEDLGRPGARPLAPDTSLMVDICTGLSVDVLDEADWRQSRKRRPKRQGKKLTPSEMNERVLRMVMDGPEIGDSSDRMRIRL